jgi:hypothetical protein
MGITVSDLDSLSAAEVEQALALVTQLVREDNPLVDAKRGVVHDLVLYFSAVLASAKDEEIDKLRQSMSLSAIVDDPSLADTDIVDAVLSNYRVTRKGGSKAIGSVTIVINRLIGVNVTAGTSFETVGQIFSTENPIAARTSAGAVISSTDVLIQAVGDGTYFFTVPVVASDDGEKDTIVRGTALTVTAAISHFVRAYAAADFTPGTTQETNEALITRFQGGISARAWSNRVNIGSMLREQTAFKDIPALSIVGMGDAEMTRDQHSILPLSLGGRTDVYAKTQSLPGSSVETITATLMAVQTTGTIWQFNLDRDKFPGFYEITRIALPTVADTDTGYEVTSITRSFNLSTDTYTPDIINADEAAYSRYQTTAIQFKDTDTAGTGLTVGTTTADYVVNARGLSLIKELQDFCNQRDVRSPAGDALIKAAVPCFLSVNFSIHKRAGEADPDVDAIKIAVATAINKLEFPGQLHASFIADVVHDYLSGATAVGAIDMVGRILRPDGTQNIIRDDAILIIPDEPAKFVTGRTTAFFLDPADIGISTEMISAPAV